MLLRQVRRVRYVSQLRGRRGGGISLSRRVAGLGGGIWHRRRVRERRGGSVAAWL